MSDVTAGPEAATEPMSWTIDAPWEPLGDELPPTLDGPVVLVGTRKGAWLLRSDASRTRWAMRGPLFLGHIVQHLVLDPRDGRTLLMATATGHLGPTVLRSTDLGTTWTEAARPPAFRTGDALGRSVTTVFWLTPGHPSRPGHWYAGCSPQGLFESNDGGATWSPVDGWNEHPSWATWAEWPVGEVGTPDGALLHSVNVDPRNPDQLYVGLSGGGIFESADGGADWRPLNEGVEADFLPGDAEFGHDPHCLRVHPAQPDRLYHQNHCGVYRLDRPGRRWERIGDHLPRDVGDIGFPIELHPRDPDVAWVFPMDGTDVWPRTSPDGRPAVYLTRDGGTSWIRQDAGFPARGWWTVKRQAMCTDDGDPVGVYLGTTGGQVWASADEGATWTRLVDHLPEIYSVEIATGLAP